MSMYLSEIKHIDEYKRVILRYYDNVWSVVVYDHKDFGPQHYHFKDEEQAKTFRDFVYKDLSQNI